MKKSKKSLAKLPDTPELAKHFGFKSLKQNVAALQDLLKDKRTPDSMIASAVIDIVFAAMLFCPGELSQAGMLAAKDIIFRRCNFCLMCGAPADKSFAPYCKTCGQYKDGMTAFANKALQKRSRGSVINNLSAEWNRAIARKARGRA